MKDLNSKKILVVDDDLGVGKYYADMISDLGNVTLAESGTKALEIVEKEDVDLCITDIVNPSLSDVHLVEKIKQRSPETKNVIISSMTDEDGMRSSINFNDNNVYGFVNAPFEDESLKDVVKDILY